MSRMTLVVSNMSSLCFVLGHDTHVHDLTPMSAIDIRASWCPDERRGGKAVQGAPFRDAIACPAVRKLRSQQQLDLALGQESPLQDDPNLSVYPWPVSPIASM